MNIEQLEEKIIKEQKRVVCFGTGLMAEEALKLKPIADATDFFMDNDSDKIGKKILLGGRLFPVLSPEQAIRKMTEQTVVLLTSGHYRAMREQLQSLGMDCKIEMYDYPVLKVSYEPDSEEFFEARFVQECLKEYRDILEQYGISGAEREQKLQDKEEYIRGTEGFRPFVIPRVMVMPTTRCNLRCKGCSSLLPYFEKPQDCDLEQILRDFKNFFRGIDQCIRITVGGEPFLYPHLKEILEYLLEEEKVLGILLITNSMIQPKDEVVRLLANPKILVEVSDYGQLEKMSRLIRILEENNVNFKVLTEQTWTDMGGTEFRDRTPEDLRFQYLNCDQSRVIKGMHNGRFYTCARSARLTALGAYESETDSFPLADDATDEEIREKLLHMYYSNHADSCNYCDLGALPTKVIPAGIQMSGNMKKSAYTIVNREEYEQLKKWAQIKD
jgi:organic radical activating enzyme